MKTINKEVSDSLHFLFHCSLKDADYTTQREHFREVYNYIEKLENNWNELKKCLKEERQRLNRSIKPINEIRKDTVDTILYKMRELENKQCHTK